jgi:hypothetical protein
MRIVLRATYLAVALSMVLPGSALAGASDREKVNKLVRKLAVPADTVFTPKFKPKAVCYCRTEANRRIGFLVTDDGSRIWCAIPTSTSPEGAFSVIDYSCQDIEVLG